MLPPFSFYKPKEIYLHIEILTVFDFGKLHFLITLPTTKIFKNT